MLLGFLKIVAQPKANITPNNSRLDKNPFSINGINSVKMEISKCPLLATYSFRNTFLMTGKLLK